MKKKCLFVCVTFAVWFLSGCIETENPVKTEEDPFKYIDIQEYACPDDGTGNPYVDQMVRYGDYVYAGLQRRNGFEPGCNSQVLKIDIATDKVVEIYDLKFKNNYSIVIVDNKLYASNPGSSYQTGDGAIEKLDLTSGKISTVITEDILGGSPNQIVHKSGTRFYVQVYIEYENVPVYEIDFDNGEIIDTLEGVVNAFGGFCYDNETERLFVSEWVTDDAGVKIFKDNIKIGETVSSSMTLPPSSMSILNGKLFLTETDYRTGILEWMKVNGESMGKSWMEISSDAIIREDGTWIYVIERFGSDKLMRIDPNNIKNDAINYETIFDEGSNPVDIEIVTSNKAYVSLQNIPRIVVIDPNIGR